MQDTAAKSSHRTLRLDPRVKIIFAVVPVQAGWAFQGVTATARIMSGHKMAVKPIIVSGRGHNSSGAIEEPCVMLIDWPW